MAPELVVSKQKLRQAEGSCLVPIKREEKNQSLAFSSRPFVLCGLPMRRLSQGDLLFERRKGSFVLQITGHPEFGLPFGQDRLVPIYLATLAVRQKSQTVRFKSGAEMLETFGMQKGGEGYKRLVGAFERIFGGEVTFRWKDYAHGNKERKTIVSGEEFLRRFPPACPAEGFHSHPLLRLPRSPAPYAAAATVPATASRSSTVFRPSCCSPSAGIVALSALWWRNDADGEV